MQELTPTWRLAALASMLCHLAVAGLAPFADAPRERLAERGAVAHVEAERDAPCSHGHDHLVCQFCRVVGSQHPDPAHPAAPSTAGGAFGVVALIPSTVPTGTAAFRTLGPRAPPAPPAIA